MAIDGQRIDASAGLDDILSVYEPGDRLTSQRPAQPARPCSSA